MLNPTNRYEDDKHKSNYYSLSFLLPFQQTQSNAINGLNLYKLLYNLKNNYHILIVHYTGHPNIQETYQIHYANRM